MTLHYFVLQPSGKIGWIENMPEEPNHLNYKYQNDFKEWLWKTPSHMNQYGDDYDQYLKLRQSAIASAVEVSNQEEVRQALLKSLNWNPHPDEHRFEPGKPYSLLCSVEKKVCEDACQNLDNDGSIAICRNGGCAKTLALVTFSEPAEKKKLIPPQPVPRMKCCGKPWRDCTCKHEKKPAAGIEPEKETQEELIRTIIDMALNRGFRSRELTNYFTITRKNNGNN